MPGAPLASLYTNGAYEAADASHADFTRGGYNGQKRCEEADMGAKRNIVFDMGNVLMTFDGREFARVFTDSEEDAQALYEGFLAAASGPCSTRAPSTTPR